MFAPKLYTVRKFTFNELFMHNFNWELTREEERRYYIKQQDNMLFRQVRLILIIVRILILLSFLWIAKVGNQEKIHLVN